MTSRRQGRGYISPETPLITLPKVPSGPARGVYPDLGHPRQPPWPTDKTLSAVDIEVGEATFTFGPIPSEIYRALFGPPVPWPSCIDELLVKAMRKSLERRY